MNDQIEITPKNPLEELYLDARLLGQDTDQIVGLVHKQYFIRDLHRRAYECSRYDVKVSVVLIKITNLAESFIDKASFAAVLDRIGTLIEENIRLTDLATWYTSNGFAIQMPHVDSGEAKLACQRIIEVMSRKVGFRAIFDYQIDELDDSYTAVVLLNDLKSQFRMPTDEQSILFQLTEH